MGNPELAAFESLNLNEDSALVPQRMLTDAFALLADKSIEATPNAAESQWLAFVPVGEGILGVLQFIAGEFVGAIALETDRLEAMFTEMRKYAKHHLVVAR